MPLELFHLIADADSAAVRRALDARGLMDAVSMRNISFDSHRQAFEGHGGTRVPALWDGAALHQGKAAVLQALDALRR